MTAAAVAAPWPSWHPRRNAAASAPDPNGWQIAATVAASPAGWSGGSLRSTSATAATSATRTGPFATALVSPGASTTRPLALLHGASRIELASLVLEDIDRPRHAVRLGKRPHALVLDPVSWAALERAVAHHRRLRTLNPHLLVTAKTACRNIAARGQFVSEVLHPAGVVMRDLRSTRLSRLVSTYDPMFVAASFGLTPKTATYYLGDSVDGEHLQSTNDLLDGSP